MRKESTDFVCDMDCPLRPRNGIPYCCGSCAKKRKYFITDVNKHLWSDEHGFHSSQGCKLPREEMPTECKEYDCHENTFITTMDYISGKWQALSGFEFSDQVEADTVIKSINATMMINKWGTSAKS